MRSDFVRRLDDYPTRGKNEKAVLYHFFHALGLLIVSIPPAAFKGRSVRTGRKPGVLVAVCVVSRYFHSLAFSTGRRTKAWAPSRLVVWAFLAAGSFLPRSGVLSRRTVR